MRAWVFAVLLPGVALSQAALVTPSGRAADSLLTDREAHGFHGVALVRQKGVPVLQKGYGLAQRPDTRFAPATIVQIGSNTKDFTAVAILQLMERGKLRLDDSLATFFPSAPGDKRGITLLQLLNHRSGLPHALAPDSQRVSRTEFLTRTMATPLAFGPGAREEYSNIGYSVLAAIVEQLSGLSYDRYVNDNILAPLNLRETGYDLPQFDRKRLAHGYRDDKGIRHLLDFPHPADGPSWTLRGNGGMLSTVADMAKFYQALFETEKLVSSGSRKRLFDPQGGLVLAGSDRVSYFMYQREPDPGFEIFLASNSTAMPAPAVLRQLAALFMARGGGVVVVAANAPAIQLPRDSVALTVQQYLDMFNGGDSALTRKFFTERVVPAPGAPPLDVRLERLRDMRSNFGTLVPVSYKALDGGRVELQARGSQGEVAVFMFEIETVQPHRMRSLRIRVGD